MLTVQGSPAAGQDNRPPHPRRTRRMKGGMPRLMLADDEPDRRGGQEVWTTPSPPRKVLTPRVGSPRTEERPRLQTRQQEASETATSPRTILADTNHFGRTFMFRDRAKPAEADQLMFSRNSFELSTREPYQRPILLESPATRSKANRMKRELLKMEHARLKSQLAALEEEAAAGFSALGPTTGYLTLNAVRPSTVRPDTAGSMASVSSASTAWYLVQHGKERALSPIGQEMEWTYTPRLPKAAAARLPKPGDWALAFQNTK